MNSVLKYAFGCCYGRSDEDDLMVPKRSMKLLKAPKPVAVPLIKFVPPSKNPFAKFLVDFYGDDEPPRVIVMAENVSVHPDKVGTEYIPTVVRTLKSTEYVPIIRYMTYGKIYKCPCCGSTSGVLAPVNRDNLDLYHHTLVCTNREKIPVEA